MQHPKVCERTFVSSPSALLGGRNEESSSRSVAIHRSIHSIGVKENGERRAGGGFPHTKITIHTHHHHHHATDICIRPIHQASAIYHRHKNMPSMVVTLSTTDSSDSTQNYAFSPHLTTELKAQTDSSIQGSAGYNTREHLPSVSCNIGRLARLNTTAAVAGLHLQLSRTPRNSSQSIVRDTLRHSPILPRLANRRDSSFDHKTKAHQRLRRPPPPSSLFVLSCVELTRESSRRPTTRHLTQANIILGAEKEMGYSA